MTVPSRPEGAAPGFSLLELVAVLAILASVAALTLPALAKTRTRITGVGCLGNLRQWGIATFLWTTDHDDRLPKDGAPNGRSTEEGWYVDLPRVLGIPPYRDSPWRTNPGVRLPDSPWICPANRRRSNSNNLFHYCLNQHVNGSGRGNQVTLSSIPSPSETVWLFDNGRLAAVAGPNNVHTNLHQRGAQILFLDGHAQRRRSADYWDFSTGRGRWSVPGLVWAPDDTGLPLTNGVPSPMPDLRWDENPALTIREAAAASRS
ncbi:MAG: hypothetical protein RLZ45_697 [Verrucomicrobiota bacterium]|jgi:prepilin-type N-terminal cleavage/methylation domain-containing protein/prepilin-type processing-associated H-X9-DG protein